MGDGFGLGLVLWTTDIPALTAFLEKAAGVTVLARHPGFAELAAGGSTIVLHADESYRGHPWYAALAKEGVARGIGAEIRLHVRDAQAAFRTALQLGALSIQPPGEVDGALECQVMGPDGFLFSFVQPLA